jgi:hypothetical protein
MTIFKKTFGLLMFTLISFELLVIMLVNDYLDDPRGLFNFQINRYN